MLERIDRYELKERIGAGGQATVYLGEDTLLKRTVAVSCQGRRSDPIPPLPDDFPLYRMIKPVLEDDEFLLRVRTLKLEWLDTFGLETLGSLQEEQDD